MMTKIAAVAASSPTVLDRQPCGPELPPMNFEMEAANMRNMMGALGRAYTPQFSGESQPDGSWLVTVQWMPIERVTVLDVLRLELVGQDSGACVE